MFSEYNDYQRRLEILRYAQNDRRIALFTKILNKPQIQHYFFLKTYYSFRRVLSIGANYFEKK